MIRVPGRLSEKMSDEFFIIIVRHEIEESQPALLKCKCNFSSTLLHPSTSGRRKKESLTANLIYNLAAVNSVLNSG